MKGFQQQELQQVIQISQRCKGCDSCKQFCPTDAIEGKYGTQHRINTEACIFCGQCLVNCPFGAIDDTVDPVDVVMAKLRDPSVTVAASTAPSVRVALGEEFGMEPGSLVTESMYGALKQAGFVMIDTNFAADNTILEEGFELIGKIRAHVLGEASGHEQGPLPQFTSCCPAWVRYVELNYPAALPHLSSAKSPLMMAGAAAKTYGAQQIWKNAPEKMFVVGIMPCTAKKFEVSRPEFTSAAAYWQRQGHSASYPDVDVVLTTRDLARLLKKLAIDVRTVPAFTDADNPLAHYSGAGTIFGVTGGVMEAALRTVYFAFTGQELASIEFTPVRGLQGVKEAQVVVPDAKTGREVTLNVAVVHGLREHIKPVIEAVTAGRSPYHFIEVMNCPGGCINGGGQPIYPMGTSWIDKYKAILPWN